MTGSIHRLAQQAHHEERLRRAAAARASRVASEAKNRRSLRGRILILRWVQA
jgi:hypothetical protein